MDKKKDGTEEISVPVLIVGGGPTGLFLSYLLSRSGVKSLVIERYPERLGAPKAHAVNPRTLEICRSYGLDVAEVRKIGTSRASAHWVNFITTLAGETVGRLPYERMDVGVLEDTPEMIHNIPQPQFERYIEGKLASDTNVEIRKGISFVSLKQGDGKVITTVERRTTREHFDITSRHVVACDGANSKVREFLRIDSDGEPSFQTMMTIHFNANLRPIVKERVGMLHWVMDPGGAGFIIGYDLSGNQVHISNYDVKETPTDAWTEEMCRDILYRAIGKEVPFEIHSFRPWIFRRQIAQSYSIGNVFLAGDAAHSFPPTGGLGLNCGLADVHNLAFKLALVHHGLADPTVTLNTYQLERRHVAVIYSLQSIKNGQSIFSLLKTAGLTNGTKDIESARQNLFKNLQDPARRFEIDAGIEGQREHFDNLEMHIGYTYEIPPLVPPHASRYVPKYRPGARIPHTWVSFPPSSRVPLPPYLVDLSYIPSFELSELEKSKRKYSTLDLVSPHAFTFLVGPVESASKDLLSTISVTTEEYTKSNPIRIQTYQLGTDFNVIDSEAGKKWVEGAFGIAGREALLIRPDQHILMRVREGETAEAILQEFRTVLGK